jgi:hypothetical protein
MVAIGDGDPISRIGNIIERDDLSLAGGNSREAEQRGKCQGQ